MSSLKFISLLFCIAVASVDFASCTKCYRCVYTDPFLDELVPVVEAAGLGGYNKECGSENPSSADLVNNPGRTSQRTPKQLLNETSNAKARLVLASLVTIPSPSVLLTQLKSDKVKVSPAQGKAIEHCVKSTIKLDTAKFAASTGQEVPEGVPATIRTVVRDFDTTLLEATNKCFGFGDMSAAEQTAIKNIGVLELQLCICNGEGCNGGKVGGGASSTYSLGIFTIALSVFVSLHSLLNKA